MRAHTAFGLFIATLITALVAACGGDSQSASDYTVAGTVTGLKGKGLVLVDERGDTLSVAADGAFTMPGVWRSGANYSVTVKTQPAGPSQACTIAGGGGSVTGNVTNVVVTCPVAVAAFSAPSSVVANTAVAFDGSASMPSDGSALTYFWDFGDGGHGGGKQIAHLFATTGAKSVTLTVSDGAGLSGNHTNTVTVTAGPSPSSTATIKASVTGLDGVALPGVTVAVVGSGASGTSDATGTASLSLGFGVPAVLRFSKPGYADQLLAVQMPSGAGADAAVSMIMRTRDAALTLADAAAGGTVTGRDGATLTLPPNALLDSTGAPVTGPVQLTLTPVDPTQPGGGGFPGNFDGIRIDGTSTPIVSYGTVEYTLSAGAQVLHLAPGKTATIAIPVYAALNLDGSTLGVGGSVPLWSLDEATGTWIQEGTGTLIAAAASPSGLALQATVSHFSWWNADFGFDPYGPKPRCVEQGGVGIPGSIDTFASATICNMLAEMDRPLTGAATAALSGGATGSKRVQSLQAAAISPVIAGFSRRASLPIAGGVRMAVPANINVRLSATAVNGTWVGSSVINGAVGVEHEEIVLMHPLAGGGPGSNALTLPADTTLALQSGQTPTFTFTGQPHSYAQVTVSQVNGSNLSGNVSVSQGATTLGTAPFNGNPGVITIHLDSAGTYTIAISGSFGVPGAFRLQVQILGGTVQNATLQLPFDMTLSLPAYTDYVGSLPSAGSQTVLFGYQKVTNNGNPNETVRAPDGSALLRLDAANFQSASIVNTARLATAGNYAVELATDTGAAAQYRITGEASQWASVAPPLAVSGAFNIANMLADRNGMPMIGYVNTINNGGHSSNVVSLRGWTGSAWTTVGPDLTIDRPCGSGLSLAFGFDASNAPILVYGNTDAAQTLSFFTAQRLVNGAWTALGASNGTLPNQSSTSSPCALSPAVTFGADGAPLVAYPVNGDVVVQRFDGTAWGDLTTAPNDRFPLPLGGTAGFDLGTDTNGRPYLVIAGVGAAGQTTVRRLSTTTPATWQAVGPNAGVLPEIGSNGLSFPKLRFDGANQPTIAFLAQPGASGRGAAVYRFDGTNWSTTGNFVSDANSYISNGSVGFTLFGGESYVTWQNTTLGVGGTFTSAPIVQKNTASGYSPVGDGQGEIPQFYAHQLVKLNGLGSVLLGANGKLYLALVAGVPGPVPNLNVYLLQKLD